MDHKDETDTNTADYPTEVDLTRSDWRVLNNHQPK